ncbi:MAG TPA: DUF1801 domain-containing protein [Candidatus Acidoferrum sp.]|jgi:hypothetical protein|nr:DUF1801 domain-containing protein [Candidatus Acidoferrum sp.]
MTVDEFVEANVAAEFKPVVAAIRALMKECAPHAEEVMSYGMPVYKAKSLFAWINPPKKDVTLSFTRGVQIEDSYGLLRGTAKAGARHVRMRTLADVDRPALGYYIEQAVHLDRS